MKTICTYISLMLMYISCSTLHQPTISTFYPDKSEACNSETIFSLVDSPPTYAGGMQKLENELNEHIELQANLNGKLYISFIINCEGKAYGFQVMKSINEETNNLIVQELKKLQNWKNGSQKEKPIDFIIIVGFHIENGNITLEHNLI